MEYCSSTNGTVVECTDIRCIKGEWHIIIRKDINGIDAELNYLIGGYDYSNGEVN